MNHLLGQTRALLQKRLGSIVDEARLLRAVAADVATYAADRLRERHRDVDVEFDPVRAILDQIISRTANRLIDVKNQVFAGIADEKRLASQVKREAESVAEWARRAAIAESEGKQTLANEAREQERAHTEQGLRYHNRLEQQRTNIERDKRALRTLNDQFENARRAQNRLSMHRRMIGTYSSAQQEQRWMDGAGSAG